MKTRRLEVMLTALTITGAIIWCILLSRVCRLQTRMFDINLKMSSPSINKFPHWKRLDNNHSIVVYNRPYWLSLETYTYALSSNCEYNNCRLTTDLSNLHNASAIIYCLAAAPTLPHMPPINQSDRNPNQVWIYFWGEPPVHHIGIGSIYQNEHWRDALNWTMSYTHDADIIFPYGILKRRISPIRNYEAIFRRKNKMAAWLVSHCYAQSEREGYVKQLQRYGIEVDIFGMCTGRRIGSNSIRKKLDSNYKFYLSFENSFCKDYITEKFFKYFNYDVILVVRGGGNYSSLVPNDSYINTADFGSVKDVANYLLSVGSSSESYINYLKSKDRFESIFRGARNQSFCKICEQLNNLEQNRRTYTDLLDRIHNGTCFGPRDLR